jgi:predicted transcriptional regulator
MRSIYSAARRVVVWTGVDDEKAAMTAIRVLEHMHLLCIQQSIEDPHFDEVNDPIRDIEMSALETFIQEQGLKDVWRSLRRLFSVPYWSRVWW